MTVLNIQDYEVSLEDCQACVGKGWTDLVRRCYELCEKEPEDVYICQVKEKFGGLRFYTLGGSDKMQDAILQIEHESMKVCEQCGKPGKLRDTGWIQTMCDEHYEEWEAERVERNAAAK